MNETNIKHGYSLMVRDARGAILNPGAQISKAGAEFMPPGAQYWGLQGLDSGLFNYISPGGRTCQVMHSGPDWKTTPYYFYMS